MTDDSKTAEAVEELMVLLSERMEEQNAIQRGILEALIGIQDVGHQMRAVSEGERSIDAVSHMADPSDRADKIVEFQRRMARGEVTRSQPSDLRTDGGQHLASLPGDELMERAVDLPDSADDTAVERGVPYISEVRNVVPFGLFVNLTPEETTDVTGLVHKSNLPRPMTRPGDYSEGDTMVVELEARKEGGDLGFIGLHAPESDPEAAEPNVPADGGQDVPALLMDLARHLYAESQDMAGNVRDPETDPRASGLASAMYRARADGLMDAAGLIRRTARWLDGEAEQPPEIAHGRALSTGNENWEGVPWRDGAGGSS